MTRFGTMDKVGLLLGAILLLVGIACAAFPHEIVMTHWAYAGLGRKTPPAALVEHVSSVRCRIYGLVAVVSGGALNALILWAAKS
jgi:hypothetical protein